MWFLLSATVLADPPSAPSAMDTVVFVEQGSSACAGTFIDEKGTVLTAYHCVVSGGRPRIETRDGRVAIGRVRRVDRRHDLALIDVPSFAGEPHLELGPQAAPGDTARVLGHPFGARFPLGFFEGTLRWSVSEGEVSAVGVRAYQTSAPINPGNSGGPLVDDQDRVIGVVSRKLRGDGVGFAGRVDGREDWLESERRWMGLGGTLGIEALVQANGVAALPLSLGLRANVNLRDRFVFSATGAFPLGIRWNAVQLGSAVHEPAEARFALRQRLFRGAWTLRLDAFAGAGLIETYTRLDEGVDLRSETQGALMVGGRLGIRNVGLEYAVSMGPVRFQRMVLTFRFGTLSVF